MSRSSLSISFLSFFLFVVLFPFRLGHVDDSAGYGQPLFYHYCHEHGHPVHGGAHSNSVARTRHWRRSHHWAWCHILRSLHSLSGTLNMDWPRPCMIITIREPAYPQFLFDILTLFFSEYLLQDTALHSPGCSVCVWRTSLPPSARNCQPESPWIGGRCRTFRSRAILLRNALSLQVSPFWQKHPKNISPMTPIQSDSIVVCVCVWCHIGFRFVGGGLCPSEMGESNMGWIFCLCLIKTNYFVFLSFLALTAYTICP